MVPMRRQERLEIRLGNANQPVDPVRDEKPIGDPATDSASRCIEGFGDLLNRVEFRRFRLIGFHFHRQLFAGAASARQGLGGDEFAFPMTSPISNRRGHVKRAYPRGRDWKPEQRNVFLGACHAVRAIAKSW